MGKSAGGRGGDTSTEVLRVRETTCRGCRDTWCRRSVRLTGWGVLGVQKSVKRSEYASVTTPGYVAVRGVVSVCKREGECEHCVREHASVTTPGYVAVRGVVSVCKREGECEHCVRERACSRGRMRAAHKMSGTHRLCLQKVVRAAPASWRTKEQQTFTTTSIIK
jgi:hypothetical protein